MSFSNLIKSKERVIDKGEVFTNFREINAMLNMVGNEARRIDSKVLEPACGNGNFVAEILNRKLVTVKQTATPKNRKTPSIKDYERLSVIAISCIYGIDIMMDNILECRKRLFAIWYDTFKKDTAKIPDNKLKSSVAFIIEHNIQCGNTISMKQVNEKAEDTKFPIVISEWSFVVGDKMQRRDYRFDELVGKKLPNSELSEAYIKNEKNYIREYIADYRELYVYA